MKLRKLNAVLSLLTTALLLDHTIFFTVWMLSRGAVPITVGQMPWVLAGFLGAHALLSVILTVRGRKGTKKGRAYPGLNKAHGLQKVTGVGMLLLLGLHIAGASSYFQPKLLHAVVQPLFFAVALAHVSVSAGRALVTLGIGNAKCIKFLQLALMVLCGALCIAGIIGFYLCLFVGVKL